MQLHVVKSVDSWESKDFDFGEQGRYNGIGEGSKSIPFSQAFNAEIEFPNRNYMDDGLETMKFSIL